MNLYDLSHPSKKKKQQLAMESRLAEFAPSGGDDGGPDEDEILFKLAKQWWLGSEQDMIRAERTLASMGWEIGEDEGSYDDGGVFVVRAGDVNGRSYQSWPHEELVMDEGAPISGDGGAVDNFKQQMANNTELAYQKKQQGMTEGDTVVKHRIGLTVTDPNHPMVSKRNEPIQKTVRVPGDDPAKAINAAIAHYRRKGYKVHDHHYMGTVDYTIDEAAPDWLRHTAGAATGALAGVGASFPGAAIAGPIGGAVAGAYGAKAGYDLGAGAADWVYDKVTGKKVPADKAAVDEDLTMKHQRDHTTQRRPDISNSLADRDFDMSEKPNVAKSADGHPTVKWRHHGHAGHTRVEPTLKPTSVQRKDTRPIPSFLKKGVAEGGYRQGFADPNAPSLGGSRRKDDEGNSEFDDRQRRQTGMIFYNVDDAETAQQLGLKQTRTGKWYLRTGNRHAQQTADRAFGLGRIWYPKNETVESEELGELSNELLGDYKRELGIRASAADRAGDFDKGHEYFKKINRATIRQGENDARRHAEKEKENDVMETRLNMMRKAGYDL